MQLPVHTWACLGREKRRKFRFPRDALSRYQCQMMRSRDLEPLAERVKLEGIDGVERLSAAEKWLKSRWIMRASS